MNLNTARAELKYPPVVRFTEIIVEGLVAVALAGGLLLAFG